RRSDGVRDQHGRHRGPDPRLHDQQLRHRHGDRAAGDLVGHLHGRPARRLLVLLPVVLPRHAHGDAGAHVRGAEDRVIAMRSGPLWLAALAASLVLLQAPAQAATMTISSGESLQAAVAAAAPGDVLTLRAGRYEGAVVIGKPLTLIGEPGATIVGPGSGSVIGVTAPDVVIRNLTITGSGLGLEGMDSGIFLTQAAARALVEGNRLENNLVGVFIHGATDAIVRGNVIEGRQDL